LDVAALEILAQYPLLTGLHLLLDELWKFPNYLPRRRIDKASGVNSSGASMPFGRVDAPWMLAFSVISMCLRVSATPPQRGQVVAHYSTISWCGSRTWLSVGTGVVNRAQFVIADGVGAGMQHQCHVSLRRGGTHTAASAAFGWGIWIDDLVGRTFQ
jgi:hypothetical protein